MKRKNKMYLLNTDIEKLNERYNVLYRQIKDNPNLPTAQIDRECEVLLEKYNFEIEELNALREVEYETQQAKIEARNREETPWRRCWLWRLIFKPVTNRAQDIIEEEAAQNADERFTPKENELINSIFELYDIDLTGLSKRKRKKLLKKYFISKSLRRAALYAADERESSNEPGDIAEQLEEIIKAADDTPPAEAFEQPEPPEAAQAEGVSEPSPATTQNKKRSRRERNKKAAQAPEESPSEQTKNDELKLEEVQTKIGAQLSLQIP